MYVYEDKKLTEAQFEILKPGLEAIKFIVDSKTLPRGMMTVEYIKTAALIHKEVFGGPNVNVGSGAAIAFMFKQIQNKINEFTKSKAAASAEGSGPIKKGSKGGKKDSPVGGAGLKADAKAA